MYLESRAGRSLATTPSRKADSEKPGMRSLYVAECMVEVEKEQMTLGEFFEVNSYFTPYEAMQIISDLFATREKSTKVHASTFDRIEIKLASIAFIEDHDVSTLNRVPV